MNENMDENKVTSEDLEAEETMEENVIYVDAIVEEEIPAEDEPEEEPEEFNLLKEIKELSDLKKYLVQKKNIFLRK